ncbi:MAG: 4-hydroxythreonine-4-phosphate dehydrogenase PdxA [Rhodobacteraceae bacterium]|nr:4-hydroxythreonine-4-phosphate dehydrogenase PdxA [Paracoccaceae bacterium]
MKLPIALTAGEPSGIGPEITLEAWHQLHRELVFFVIADRRQFPAADGNPRICEIAEPDQAAAAMRHGLPLLHLPFPMISPAGRPDSVNAPSILACIELAVEFALKGRVSAICTNPVSKFQLKRGAGFDFPGQTEFLASLCKVRHAVMLLAGNELRVVPVTTHVPLSEVPAVLTQRLITESAEILHAALVADFGIDSPRIAVAGLNPHAGESGSFGTEEQELIMPALQQLRLSGMNVAGPYSADSMFHTKARAAYDAALCMYHDQALIPLKTLVFYGSVNVTLGIPLIRTSPDHGTGFDIAGKGVARADSLISALRLAAGIASRHGVSA